MIMIPAKTKNNGKERMVEEPKLIGPYNKDHGSIFVPNAASPLRKNASFVGIAAQSSKTEQTKAALPVEENLQQTPTQHTAIPYPLPTRRRHRPIQPIHPRKRIAPSLSF